MTSRRLLGVPVTRSVVLRLIWLPPLLSGVVWIAVRTGAREVAFWQLWVLALAGLVAYLVVRAQGDAGYERMDPDPHGSDGPPSRPFAEVRRWEDRLSLVGDDLERFHRAVQRPLAGLIVERLRLRHGVVLSAQPQRARAVLGESLYALSTTPTHTPLTQAQLEHVVRCIEEI